MELKISERVNGILVAICDFVEGARKEGTGFESLCEMAMKEVKEMNGFVNGLSWRQQTAYLPKIRYHIA